MTSTKTQLPYEYYSLAFCGLENPEQIHYKKLNLGKEGVTCYPTPSYSLRNLPTLLSLAGEVLRGDRIVNTLYTVSHTLSVYVGKMWYVHRITYLFLVLFSLR